jgi:hypothetical protein
MLEVMFSQVALTVDEEIGSEGKDFYALHVFAVLHKHFVLPSSITFLTREPDAGANISSNLNKTYHDGTSSGRQRKVTSFSFSMLHPILTRNRLP